METSTTRDTDYKRLLHWAAGLSMAAAVLHVVAAPEHLDEWWGYGLFFFLAAAAQALYSVILLLEPWQYATTREIREDAERYGRPYYIVGILGNAAVIALYVITRTVGIPLFGPHAGEVEPVTLLSLASKIVEAALIVCLFALLRRSETRVHE